MANNEKIQEAYEKLEQGLADLLNSDQWKQFLKFQTAFRSYSFHNQLMIFTQCPNATLVAGFRKWNELGRRVKKGEKAIKVFAPLKVKLEQDSVTNGCADQEPSGLQKLVGFGLVNIFDISQTEGAPIPAPIPMISACGESKIYELLKEACPLPVIEEVECDGAYGYINFSHKKIYILSTLTAMEKATTLVHEWGHWLLHALRRDLDTGIKELEAESVSFIVCDTLGIDTSQFSFVYIAEWCHREDVLERLKVSGDRICKASREILDSLNNNVWSEAV